MGKVASKYHVPRAEPETASGEETLALTLGALTEMRSAMPAVWLEGVVEAVSLPVLVGAIALLEGISTKMTPASTTMIKTAMRSAMFFFMMVLLYTSIPADS